MAEAFFILTCRCEGAGRIRSAEGVYVKVYLLSWSVEERLVSSRPVNSLPSDFSYANSASLVQ